MASLRYKSGLAKVSRTAILIIIYVGTGIRLFYSFYFTLSLLLSDPPVLERDTILGFTSISYLLIFVIVNIIKKAEKSFKRQNLVGKMCWILNGILYMILCAISALFFPVYLKCIAKVLFKFPVAEVEIFISYTGSLCIIVYLLVLYEDANERRKIKKETKSPGREKE